MPLLTVNDIRDISVIFRGRFGNALGRSLMHILSIDRVNDLYDRNSHLVGPDFARAVLADIGLKYEILNEERLADLPEGPFITICNHPYGSIDGVVLVDLFGHVRPDFKVMVNRLLGRIDTMQQNFICVTPTGNERHAPTNESIQGIKNAMMHVRNGGCLGIFPSGAVSDLSLKDRCVRDREWQEPVVRLIRNLKVPVVPIHFLDRNSAFYYSLGLIDWRVRLLRLPAEVFNKAGKPARIAIGEIITPARQKEFTDIGSFRDFLRSSVYNL